ncbi:Phosphoribosyl-AMP cyclohydrolase [Candidatus Protofrankia datiscae]|uniref:Phosphoribosyl-AMP cyclohydrolase n=1 Tax=Candidatus Protofrankia datiscae TaxID=2716812 RepID=F8B5R9_9ACTN|nr:Phosphoribosyl-AMP cyclohydrolase [Candidatus Protofrankia datiscae]
MLAQRYRVWPGRQARHNGHVPAPSPQLDPAIADRLKRDAAGLFPAVAQQYDTGEVLMVGWMDDEALRRTLTTGRATYWSRSRREYWVKGDTSGNLQLVRSVSLDCDGDTVLVQVDQVGPACHTGSRSCFDGRRLPVTVIDPPRARDARRADAAEPARGAQP